MAKIKYFELYYFFEFLCSVASGVRNFKSKWKILTSKFCTGSPQWNGKSKNGDTVWFVFLAAVIFKKIRIKQCKIPKNTFWKWLWPKKSDPSSARCNMAPFKDDCGQKNRTKQCKVQNSTFSKWLWPKKSDPSSARHKKTPFQMTVAKKNGPNSVRYKMAPFKNDCGPKNPNQTVQDSKKHLLKMTVAKNPIQAVQDAT